VREQTCPKCGSPDIIPNVVIPDHYELGMANEMIMRISENPSAWIFKGTQKSTMRAWICGECGFVEMYVTQPRVLWEAWQKAQQQSPGD